MVNFPTVPTDPTVVQGREGSAAQVCDELAATTNTDIMRLTSKLTVIRMAHIC